MKRVFCIGNGKSRKDFNLWLLKPHGYIYGCNAIYRDHPDVIDVLTAVDNGIIHEIYHSGFATKKPCYFRNWSKLPKMTFETTVHGIISADELKEISEYDVIKENKEDRDQAEEFVVHGTNLKGMVSVLRNAQKNHKGAPKDIIKKKIDTSHIYVSWIKKGDMSFDLKDCWKEYKDHGWACGASSGYVAAQREKPDEIYLIGHDLVSNDNKVNNLYAGTKHYVAKENGPTPHVNWVNQWYTLMDYFPKIKFFKVNEELDDKPANREIHEWKKWKDRGQLHYITQAQLLDRLQNY